MNTENLTQHTPAGASAASATLTVYQLVRNLRSELNPIYGSNETDAMIRLIFERLKGWGPVDIIINEQKPVSDYIRGKVDEIVERLRHHEPIQYIIGKTYFYGMDMEVGPGVLIPRPETEELIDLIVNANKSKDLHVLDLCTGSGCIAIALSRNLLFPRVEALELSEEALKYARRNAEDLHADIKFIHADIFKWDGEPETYDIMVSNPPYVNDSEKADMEANVLDNEPAEALFVPDSKPLVYYDRISDVALRDLKPGGRLYFEINPRHWKELTDMLTKKGFERVDTLLDVHARKRFLKCVKPGKNG